MKIVFCIPLLLHTVGTFGQYQNGSSKELRKINKVKEIVTYQFDLVDGDSTLVLSCFRKKCESKQAL